MVIGSAYEWGPRLWRTLSQRGWANGGWRGLRPLPGGLGDLPPRTKNKGRVANSCNPATSGTQNAGKPSANGGGKMGGQGGKAPMAGGMGDVPFRPNPLAPFPAREGGKFGGVLPSPPRKGAGERLTPANPQPTRVGKTGGPGGRSPHGRGYGGCAPTKPKEGASCPH